MSDDSSYVGWTAAFAIACGVCSVGIQAFYTKRTWRQSSLIIHAIIVVSTFVCIMPFPLLALDVDAGLKWQGNATSYDDMEVVGPPSASWMKSLWLTLFLATQVMSFVLLPVAQEYVTSGEFTVGARVKYSIKENVRLYIILGIVVGVLFAYVVFLKGLHTFKDILAMIMAAANSLGLFLAVLFLSNGLVGVPQWLWRMADPLVLIQFCQWRAPGLFDDSVLSKMEISEIRSELMALDSSISEDERPRYTTMLENIAAFERSCGLEHTAATRAKVAESVKKEPLASINSRLQKAIIIGARQHHQWQELVKQCLDLDSIVAMEQRPVGAANPMARYRLMYWTCVRRPLLKVLSLCAAFMSLLILWCELVVPFQNLSTKSLSISANLVRVPKFEFLFSVITISYMAGVSYWATFQFKIFDAFALVPSYSDCASLCFITTFLTRLILPLCYNFLWISQLTGQDEHVVYSSVFGKVDVVDFLGNWFNRFMPIFIPAFAFLNATNIYAKLLACIGVKTFSVRDMNDENVVEGRRIIETYAGRQLSVGKSALMANDAAAATKMDVTDAPKKERGARYAEYKARRAAPAETV